jgi:hypothetical protein
MLYSTLNMQLNYLLDQNSSKLIFQIRNENINFFCFYIASEGVVKNKNHSKSSQYNIRLCKHVDGSRIPKNYIMIHFCKEETVGIFQKKYKTKENGTIFFLLRLFHVDRSMTFRKSSEKNNFH